MTRATKDMKTRERLPVGKKPEQVQQQQGFQERQQDQQQSSRPGAAAQYDLPEWPGMLDFLSSNVGQLSAIEVKKLFYALNIEVVESIDPVVAEESGPYTASMPDGFTPEQLAAAEREIAKRRGLSLAQYHAALDAAAPAPVTKAKPRPKWEDRKGADAKLSPPEFIAKHYAAEMTAGTLHRGIIAQGDKPLAVKLASWLRSHPMPENIDIPTKPEWITRQAEAGKARPAPAPRTQGQRLYDALRGRHRRAVM